MLPLPTFPPSYQSNLANLLAEFRRGLGFSLREVARTAGAVGSQIMRVESGEYRTSAELAVRISTALGVPVGLAFEAAFTPEREPYAKLMAESMDLRGLLKKAEIAGKRDVMRYTYLASTIAILQEFFLMSSNPLFWCERMAFPSTLLLEDFTRQATLIPDFDPLTRLDHRSQLFSNPVHYLSNRVLSEDTFREVQQRGKSGECFGWNPFAGLAQMIAFPSKAKKDVANS